MVSIVADKATGDVEVSPLGCAVIGARFLLLIAMAVAVLACLLLFAAQFVPSWQPALTQPRNPLLPLLRLIREAIGGDVAGADVSPLLAAGLLVCARSLLDSLLAAVQPRRGASQPAPTHVRHPKHSPAHAPTTSPSTSNAELERLRGRPRDQLLAEIAASKRKVQGLTGQERMEEMARVALLQQALGASSKPLAFLALDVVGSTRMKAHENPMIVEHAFLAFRRWAEQILAGHQVWKSAWTPDGAMAAFREIDQALGAGKDLLLQLEAFNRDGHEMTEPFRLRLGISQGDVIFDDQARMEEVSDSVIDLAGHLQKDARPNSILIARRDLAKLRDKQGFRAADKQVDGHEAWEWSLP